jgi:hypothetical protein
MSATAGDHPLHDCLKQFLASAEVRYVPVTARLISLSPAQLTQDDECFLEATALAKDLLRDAKLTKTDLARSKVQIRLADWKFVFSKIPNSTDYYLDIDVKQYEVLPPGQARGGEGRAKKCINILEINPYQRLYEEALQRVARSRDEGPQHSSTQLLKAISSSKIEQKGDNGSNQNKYSFRTRSNLPNQLNPRDSATTEDLTTKKLLGESDLSQKNSTPGLRVSGINGKQNMKKLKDFKRSYITASQDSITNQVISSDQLGGPYFNGNKNDDSPPKAKEKPTLLMKRTFEEEDNHKQRQLPSHDDNLTRKLPVADRSRQGIVLTVPDESQGQKKLKMSNKLDFQLGGGGLDDETLNYDELMDCLSLERGLVHWEDLVFSKEVVKYLKNNISDLVDKK